MTTKTKLGLLCVLVLLGVAGLIAFQLAGEPVTPPTQAGGGVGAGAVSLGAAESPGLKGLHADRSEARAPKPGPALFETAVEVLDERGAARSGCVIKYLDVRTWFARRDLVRDWPASGVVTDVTGRCSISHAPRAILVGAYDASDGATAIAFAADGACRIQLPRCPSLAVHVVSQSGRPVAGASVRSWESLPSGQIVEVVEETNDDGVASLRCPCSRQGISVSVSHPTQGYGSAFADLGVRELQVALRGDHLVDVTLGGEADDPGDVTMAIAVIWRDAPLWQQRFDLAKGALLELGRVPDGSTVIALAHSSDGAFGHIKRVIQRDEHLECTLLPSIPLAIHVTGHASKRQPLAVGVRPPVPFDRFLDYPDLGALFSSSVDPSADMLARLIGLPRFGEASGKWRAVLNEAGAPVPLSPATFSLSTLLPNPEGGLQLELQASAARGLHVDGSVTDAVSGAPIPGALLSLRTPGTAGAVTVTSADGRYVFLTRRPAPMTFFVEAPGYVPATADLLAKDVGQECAQRDFALVPASSDELCTLRVQVGVAAGAPVPYAEVRVHLQNGAPLGSCFCSETGQSTSLRVPAGSIWISVVPPGGSDLLPYRRSHDVTSDADVEVLLEALPTVAVVDVRLATEGDLDVRQRALLVGNGVSLISAFSSGRAHFEKVPFGSYRLTLRLPGGVLHDMGSVIVHSPSVVVRRALEPLCEVRLQVGSKPAHGLRRARVGVLKTGRVLSHRLLEDAEIIWSLPVGEYFVDVFDESSLGQASLAVAFGERLKRENITASMRSGTAALQIDATSLVRRAQRYVFRALGPVTREWLSDLHFVNESAVFLAAGLPAGSYEFEILSEDGSLLLSAGAALQAGRTTEVQMR